MMIFTTGRQNKEADYLVLNKTHTSLGFSLLEMMLVMVLIAILASICWPSFQSSFQNYKSQDIYRQISRVVWYTQLVSVVTNRNIDVQFNVDDQFVQIETMEKEYYLPNSVKQFLYAEWKKVVSKKDVLAFESSAIQFFNDGTLSQTKMVICIKRHCQTLSIGSPDQEDIFKWSKEKFEI